MLVHIVCNSDSCAMYAAMVAGLVGVQVAMACGMEWSGTPWECVRVGEDGERPIYLLLVGSMQREHEALSHPRTIACMHTHGSYDTKQK